MEGEEVLKDLMENNHVFTGTFATDALSMAFREGQRYAVLQILSKLSIDAIKFAKMYDESQGDSF
jgi:hypothetical protein